MTIHQFNLKTQYSIFEERQLVTDFHSHPAIEIVIAKSGFFDLKSQTTTLENIQFGIVPPNMSHALNAANAVCEIIVIESAFVDVDKLFRALNLSNKNDVSMINNAYLQNVNRAQLEDWCSANFALKMDARIVEAIAFIHENNDKSSLSLSEIAAHISLSASRLSHLFKEKIGLSVQKYIIWTRMKVAVDYLIQTKMHLTTAAHRAGFFDSAHFTRHFKEFFGVKPSLVYNNSCSVQDSAIETD